MIFIKEPYGTVEDPDILIVFKSGRIYWRVFVFIVKVLAKTVTYWNFKASLLTWSTNEGSKFLGSKIEKLAYETIKKDIIFNNIHLHFIFSLLHPSSSIENCMSYWSLLVEVLPIIYRLLMIDISYKCSSIIFRKTMLM